MSFSLDSEKEKGCLKENNRCRSFFKREMRSYPDHGGHLKTFRHHEAAIRKKQNASRMSRNAIGYSSTRPPLAAPRSNVSESKLSKGDCSRINSGDPQNSMTRHPNYSSATNTNVVPSTLPKYPNCSCASNCSIIIPLDLCSNVRIFKNREVNAGEVVPLKKPIVLGLPAPSQAQTCGPSRPCGDNRKKAGVVLNSHCLGDQAQENGPPNRRRITSGSSHVCDERVMMPEKKELLLFKDVEEKEEIDLNCVSEKENEIVIDANWKDERGLDLSLHL